HARDFDGLDIGRLPTTPPAPTDTLPQTLFRQFRRLAAYAALRRELSPGSDDLITVLEKAHRRFALTEKSPDKALGDDVSQAFADLVRRDVGVVRGVMTAVPAAVKVGDELRADAPQFATEAGVRDLWDTLKL